MAANLVLDLRGLFLMKKMLCTIGNQIFSFGISIGYGIGWKYRPIWISVSVSDLNQNSSFGRTLHLPLHTTQGCRGLEIGNPGGGIVCPLVEIGWTKMPKTGPPGSDDTVIWKYFQYCPIFYKMHESTVHHLFMYFITAWPPQISRQMSLGTYL